jgi:hypothetical protein
MEGLKRPTKNLSLVSRSSGWNLNTRTLRCKAGVLTTRQRCPVWHDLIETAVDFLTSWSTLSFSMVTLLRWGSYKSTGCEKTFTKIEPSISLEQIKACSVYRALLSLDKSQSQCLKRNSSQNLNCHFLRQAVQRSVYYGDCAPSSILQLVPTR